MEYITLKNTDLRVSRLCMGGCPLGGYGWGDVSQKLLLDAVGQALDLGITFFDTADTYGLGQSERTLGQALAGHRHEVVIASKFGVRAGKGKTRYDNSPDYIRRALEDSLTRLQTDYIDLYQVHYRDGITPIEDVIGALEEAKVAGKIRAYGMSNIHMEDSHELEPYKGRLASLQDEYSLACRKNERDIVDLSGRLEMTPLTWGSLGQGILTGKYHKDNVDFKENDRRSRDVYVNFHGEKLLKNLEIVEEMRKIADGYKKPLSALAIRFILDYLPDSVVLFGAKNPDQVKGNVEGADWRLKEEDIRILDEVSR